MTLWCMFRSPLMLGAELTKLDGWTEALITNSRVLRLVTDSHGARQVMRDDGQAVWVSEDNDGKAIYVAVFNLSDTERRIAVCADEMELADMDSFRGMKLEELWSGETILNNADNLEATVPAHGARLFRIKRPA